MVIKDIFQNIKAYIKFLHKQVNIKKWTHDLFVNQSNLLGIN